MTIIKRSVSVNYTTSLHESGIHGDVLTTRIEFHSYSSRPYEIRLVFPDDIDAYGDHAFWVFSRELLSVGRSKKTGIGDVIVRPNGRWLVEVELQSPDGHAIFTFNRVDVDAFLSDSYKSAPVQTEDHIINEQIDTFLTHLFA